jgi:hypothetical protein
MSLLKTPIKTPILRDINNSVTKSKMGMPMKDITSDNTSTFELNRKIFLKSYINSATDSNTPGVAKIERDSLGLSANQIVITGPAVKSQKKWMNKNRDASNVTANRRIYQSGRTMANLQNQSISFVSDKDYNVTRHALSRVRGGGAANVPKARATISKNAKVFPATY